MQQESKWKADIHWQTVAVLLIDELKAIAVDSGGSCGIDTIMQMIGHNMMQAIHTILSMNDQVSRECASKLALYIANEGRLWAPTYSVIRALICVSCQVWFIAWLYKVIVVIVTIVK